MDGWETLTTLRAVRPDLTVILTSGFSEAQVMAGKHPAYPQAFLQKPYGLRELEAALTRALGK
jgi:CheY-like chemotaxis protein